MLIVLFKVQNDESPHSQRVKFVIGVEGHYFRSLFLARGVPFYESILCNFLILIALVSGAWQK